MDLVRILRVLETHLVRNPHFVRANVVKSSDDKQGKKLNCRDFFFEQWLRGYRDSEPLNRCTLNCGADSNEDELSEYGQQLCERHSGGIDDKDEPLAFSYCQEDVAAKPGGAQP